MFWQNKRKIDFSQVSSDSRHSQKGTLNTWLTAKFREVTKIVHCFCSSSVASEILQALDQLEGLLTVHDDVVIYGIQDTEEEATPDYKVKAVITAIQGGE